MSEYSVSGLLKCGDGFVRCEVQYIQAETVEEAIAQAHRGWGFLRCLEVRQKDES